jgi:hypothetical protein
MGGFGNELSDALYAVRCTDSGYTVRCAMQKDCDHDVCRCRHLESRRGIQKEED